MKSLRAFGGILLTASLVAAQRAENSVQSALPVVDAGTFHVASGVLTAPDGIHHLVTPGVVYDNTCPTGFFASLLNGNIVIDEGRLPGVSSPAPNTGAFNTYRITSFQIAYCTRELDPGLGGPGAEVEVYFWELYSPCTDLATAGPASVGFSIPGLPASTAVGTLSCWTVTIDLSGGNEFYMLAEGDGTYDANGALDSFGYGLAMPNQTGTTTATAGGFLIAGDLATCDMGDATYYKNPGATNGTGLDNLNSFRRDGTNAGQGLGCFWFGGVPHGGFYMRVTGDLDDCNGNNEPDALDVASGSSTDFNSNDIPDECEDDGSVAYCFGDGSGTACPCGNTGAAGAGCANSETSGTRMFKLGTVSVGADDLEFYSVDAPVGVPGLYFLGQNQASATFGDGLRCVGQIRKRYPVQTSSAAGVFHQPNVISLAGALVPVGSTRHFQNWYRDLTGPCSTGVNTSNGLSVTFAP